METDDVPLYQIWGADYAPYGPVELPALVNWIKEERVVADTWVYVHATSAWLKAAQVPELKMFFQPKPPPVSTEGDAAGQNASFKLTTGSLRRIKLFAEMDDSQLQTFLSFIDVVPCRPSVCVVKRGDPGDAMYMVLEGEVRSCLMVDGIETPIATLPAGSIFGEISLLDHGPHAADVITNQESTLLRISLSNFDQLIREAPDAALPFLLTLSKAIAGRARVLTRRYEDSIHMSQTGSEALATT